ncbi:MAG: hypothetical protein WC238_00425 [Parcubacteria group bacterium]|jgi:hypothetical protein
MKFTYKLIGWSRRNDIDLGSCVFSIELDARFAEKARNFHFENQHIFEERIREIIGYKYARATFLNDTAFLRSMSVEGNCACLGVSGNLLDADWSGRDVIVYNGHNVDSKAQAFDLLTIFTYWVDIVEALTHDTNQKTTGGK